MSRAMFLQERTYEYLSDLIFRDKLSYDTIYSEAKIAEDLGCSRTPVREALARLEHDHYIDIIPSKGFQLHRITKDDMMNTYQMRVATESFAALSIMNARDTAAGKECISGLRLLVEEQEKCVKENDYQRFLTLDIEFHSKMIAFPGNEDFVSLYRSHRYRIEKIANKSFSINGRCANSAKEHRAILDALVNGEIEDCYKSIVAHNEATYAVSIKVLEKQAEEKPIKLLE